VALAVIGDSLRVAVHAVFVGAANAQVFTGYVDAVSVDCAGVADVGLLFALGPMSSEGGGAMDGRALGGEAVHGVVESHRGGAFTGGVLCA
jgi:hypothetical protein